MRWDYIGIIIATIGSVTLQQHFGIVAPAWPWGFSAAAMVGGIVLFWRTA